MYFRQIEEIKNPSSWKRLEMTDYPHFNSPILLQMTVNPHF